MRLQLSSGGWQQPRPPAPPTHCARPSRAACSTVGRAPAVASAVALLVMPCNRAAAENRVTIRGAYYREASTRVVQPVVDLRHDLPAGFDVGAHYLLDAITSASVAAGVSTDSIFTEVRNEAGLAFGKSWGRTRAGFGYRYSAESDYWSHTLSLNLSQRLWGDSTTLGVGLGRGFDSVASRFRTLPCLPTNASGQPVGSTCGIDVWFGALSVSQVLSPTLLAQASYEVTLLDGFQSNLYRAVPGHGFETVPDRRQRHAVTARLADYVPGTRTGLQLQYRYYLDRSPGGDPNVDSEPWGIRGHMVEARVYQVIGRDLEIRGSYRHYTQTSAGLWCDLVASPGCYGPTAAYYAADPKLGSGGTQLPELKLWWEATALGGAPFLGWFARGTFEVSYGYLMQSTVFGNAHLLQAGYSMPY